MYKWKMKWYNSYLSKVALANDNLVIVVISGKKAGPHACDKRKKIQESALFYFESTEVQMEDCCLDSRMRLNAPNKEAPPLP